MQQYTFSQFSKLKGKYIQVTYSDAELEATLQEPRQKLIEWCNRTTFTELPTAFYNRLIFKVNGKK